MNDVIIRASNLTKTYRLYGNPRYRLLDMFGLLPNNGKRFTEHTAIDRINLEVRRGEKVAIIGRNGAGKSTLLKLISNVIRATSGTLEVKGDARALLQIGSGFHPDFSGRENVYAYLAHLGVVGKEADDKLADIIDFAELEEYIDQPVKTYSTGMGVRLMFATSTAVAPDILVLDEVLSVGDAYFSHKSFDRITELSERHGTTMLLVSHEIYSAAKLCPRVIWLDHGQVLIDGDGATVIKAYEDSIREQEEQRLRKRKQDRLKKIGSNKVTDIIVEFRSPNNIPQRSSVYFSSVQIRYAGVVLASLPLDATVTDETVTHLQKEASNWGPPVTWQNRTARPMLNFGTSFHKAAGIFRISSIEKVEGQDLQLYVEYWSDVPSDLLIRIFYHGRQFDLGAIPPTSGQWTSHEVGWSVQNGRAASAAATFLTDISLTGIHGSGRIGINDLTVLNEGREDTHVLHHGGPARFQIHYHVRDPEFAGTAQVLLVLHRDGILDVGRFMTADLLFGKGGSAGVIELEIPKLNLGNGRYSLSVMIAKDGYFDRDQFLFYSINPDVYVCASRLTEFDVVGGGPLGNGTVFLGEGRWSMRSENPTSPGEYLGVCGSSGKSGSAGD